MNFVCQLPVLSIITIITLNQSVYLFDCIFMFLSSISLPYQLKSFTTLASVHRGFDHVSFDFKSPAIKWFCYISILFHFS